MLLFQSFLTQGFSKRLVVEGASNSQGLEVGGEGVSCTSVCISPGLLDYVTDHFGNLRFDSRSFDKSGTSLKNKDLTRSTAKRRQYKRGHISKPPVFTLPHRRAPSLGGRGSRLSFPATEPPDPRRVSEGFNPRTPEGFQKGFRRVSEGFSKGFRRVLEGVSRGPFANPSKTLQRPLLRPFLKPF